VQTETSGHGYTVLEVLHKNPFFERGDILKGHEFHYTSAVIKKSDDITFLFKMPGIWLDGERMGVQKKSFGHLYHMHATGSPCWGKGFSGCLQSKKPGYTFFIYIKTALRL
jgi:cobyrinic acid a,c-diamide synthase